MRRDLLTIKNIFKIDSSFLLFTIIVILTGMFKHFLIIFSLIIIHECGHFLIAKLFKWKVSCINIYPFGGCVKFDDNLNKPIYEELLILVSGPLFQIIGFLIFSLFLKNYFSYSDYYAIKSYNYTLLIFNLLPIYPLDGGKLFNLLCNYFFSYKIGNKIVIVISYFLVLIMFFLNKNVNLLFMLVLLIFNITVYLKNQDFLYQRFQLERYLNDYKFKKYKVINNSKKMYRDKRHIIKDNDSYITEKMYLKKKFREKL